ncbi:uncharacterized protein Z519_01300 [Cladophialophora bantiana CBS 173.52]|uniref:Uncharacterized protein n=1 Tax=Cladophialophora bantiana (strain ATCC 10958 / CBS 173.52 / CDC B-1940 / NIH 8579) TaxID=1442370 RepID=A0A0D2F691_CLAB1|nr:uncharacterized protein Z519_01300 [Cladophialophora bantiana CBS 173.52]KIW97716.1 hypothetical protein Z519_01300 [Cladophialophora bantiana CBS 173.52]
MSSPYKELELIQLPYTLTSVLSLSYFSNAFKALDSVVATQGRSTLAKSCIRQLRKLQEPQAVAVVEVLNTVVGNVAEVQDNLWIIFLLVGLLWCLPSVNNDESIRENMPDARLMTRPETRMSRASAP